MKAALVQYSDSDSSDSEPVASSFPSSSHKATLKDSTPKDSFSSFPAPKDPFPASSHKSASFPSSKNSNNKATSIDAGSLLYTVTAPPPVEISSPYEPSTAATDSSENGKRILQQILRERERLRAYLRPSPELLLDASLILADEVGNGPPVNEELQVCLSLLKGSICCFGL
jgi:hypothetical protein